MSRRKDDLQLQAGADSFARAGIDCTARNSTSRWVVRLQVVIQLLLSSSTHWLCFCRCLDALGHAGGDRCDLLSLVIYFETVATTGEAAVGISFSCTRGGTDNANQTILAQRHWQEQILIVVPTGLLGEVLL